MNQQTQEEKTKTSDDPAYDGEQTLIQNILPKSYDPYLRLIRIDRPIGIWLLTWPAFWGLAAAFSSDVIYLMPQNWQQTPIVFFALFFVGAFLTRSAGCVFNDIADRNIDNKVARTKNRPIASGEVSVKAALILLVGLGLLALLVLLQFNLLTIALGVFIVIPILIYPFLKRYTYYPQAMLSLCFSWGALMGWTAVTNQIQLAGILITIAAFSWTMGFDTIYAHQDKEDDAVIGMKSTALAFGDATPKWLTVFYTITLVLLFIVGWLIGAQLIYFTSLAMASLHASWQINTLKTENAENCLKRFRSNNLFGIIILVGFLADLLFTTLITAGP